MSKSELWQAVVHICAINSAKVENAKYAEFSEAVRRDFYRSARPIVFIAVLSAVVLWLTGRIGPGLDFHWGRACASAGALLAGWATWFALADGNNSWGRERPDELARVGIFRVLMWPGVLLSVVGAAWWP